MPYGLGYDKEIRKTAKKTPNGLEPCFMLALLPVPAFG
jgi:hypothetical protein